MVTCRMIKLFKLKVGSSRSVPLNDRRQSANFSLIDALRRFRFRNKGIEMLHGFNAEMH